MRRSKAPLAMMEQMVMILVFALAAALCLQAFVRSDAMSKRSEARDRAAVLCQSAAAAVQHCNGDMAAAAGLLGIPYSTGGSGDGLMADYDGDWNPAQGTMRYTLGVAPMESDVPGLGRATVWVRDEAEETELFRMEIAWQEVSAHG